MTRRNWILIAVAVGIGAAILIGIFGGRGGNNSSSTSSTTAQQSLCTSLDSHESATKSLTGLSPQSASKSDYQNAVTSIQNDWKQVQTDASAVASSTMSTLTASWDAFSQAVQSVPGSASVSTSLQDVQTQGQALVTTTQSTLTSLSCS
jgi:hypothetical protein